MESISARVSYLKVIKFREEHLIKLEEMGDSYEYYQLNDYFVNFILQC